MTDNDDRGRAQPPGGDPPEQPPSEQATPPQGVPAQGANQPPQPPQYQPPQGQPHQYQPPPQGPPQQYQPPPQGPPFQGPPPQGPPPQTGTIRYQEPNTTRPRPPSVAEQRARQQAMARQFETDQQAERRAKTRRRVLLGTGVTVGVVALIAGWYVVAVADDDDDEVVARCVDQNNVVVDEDFCDESRGRVGPGGFIFIGGNSYRYYYGGTGAPGTRAVGGTTVRPSGTNISTPSGKPIQRGGFGVRGSSGGS